MLAHPPHACRRPTLNFATARGVLLALFALCNATDSLAAEGYFCCTSSEQRKVCGAPLPLACHGQAYREFNGRGVLVRDVPAPLSPLQQAKLAEEEALRREQAAVQAAAAAELRRQETALLNTYAGIDDIERVRARAAGDLQRSVQQSEQKLAQLRKERQRLQAEAEFYQKKPMPLELSKGLRTTAADITAQEAEITLRLQELAELQRHFASEKERYQALLDRQGNKEKPGRLAPAPRPH